MTELPRYLVAKHISDLQRMEPRNIGIIVWTPKAVAGRFLAERHGAPGEVDGRNIPAFVSSTRAYKQWIGFWRDQLTAKPVSSGKALHKWVESLKQSSCGNFCLSEGGTILSEVQPEDVFDLADDLFSQLVGTGTAEEPLDVALDRMADDVIRRLRLARNANFYTRYQIACPVAPNVNENFEFSHAYKNGALKRLYQRVPLAGKRIPLRRAVHDSAWMFEKVVQHRIITRNQAIALVFVTDQQRKDPGVSWSFEVLGAVARIANLADPNEALGAFAIED